MLHFIIFKIALKENWIQLSSPECLMNLPHFCFRAIHTFICKLWKKERCHLHAKPVTEDLLFISGSSYWDNALLYIVVQ